jgi:hypothetical protein
MLLVSAALIVLVVRETRSDGPETAATTPLVTDAQQEAAVTTSAPEPSVTTTASSRPRPTPSQPLAQLTVIASGGDSWLAVRTDSAQGRVLYEGVLAEGSGINVKAKRLWVRFGGASNLTAELNGKPLTLPAGTYNAFVSSRGLQLVSG